MFVLDRTLNTSHILTGNKNSQSAFWEDTYTQEFDTGAESLEFSCYTHESIKEGNYVAFFYNSQYKMFQITEIEEVHKNGRLVSECYCETASLQLLNNHVRPFSGDMNCIQFFEHILSGTEWRIGKYSNSLKDKVITINESSIESVWSLIEDYKDLFECEINTYITYENGHVTGQFIDVFSEKGLGSATYKRFEYGKNVTGITKKKDLYDWCTGIIIDCQCDVTNTIIDENQGLGFVKGAGDVILDDNHNRMYNAGRNHVIGVYSGDETEPIEACINAWKELEKRSVPKFDYQVTTALRDDEYDEIHLGDTVYVVDHSYTPPLLLEARVGKLELSFTDRSNNKCTLTNYKEIKSKLLDADYIKLTGTITDIVNAFFPITSEGIADGAICEGKIDTVYYQEITADIVSAGIGVFENLYAQNMTVINADIQNLRAEKADISQLNATNANIGVLNTDVANIKTLVNGHLTSDNIQSLILTSDKVTVADAFIKNAMIASISANKINTGTINTNNVNIQSADGSMVLNGSLQQFKDKNGKVRIQIGKDAQGNFTFSLFDENGTGILIDENGITENAIADGLIVNDMVADNANISGSKLDIDSVVSEINEGTTTIKGSKVLLDENNQTLNVAFNSLTTKIDDIEIGGTNLFPETKEFNKLVGGQSKTSEIYKGFTVRGGTKSSTDPKVLAEYSITEFDYGDEFTFSFYARATGQHKISAYFYGQPGYVKAVHVDSNSIQGSNSAFGDGYTNFGNIDSEWKRYWVTWRLDTTGDISKGKNILLRDNSTTTGYEIYTCGWKLEKGNKATDWSPNPNDIEDKITSNTTAINVQQGKIESLITSTTITKENGQVVSLKDDYNITKSTVAGNTTKIGSLTSTVDSVSSKQATFQTDLNGFKTTVQQTYTTKTEFEGLKIGGTNLYPNSNFADLTGELGTKKPSTGNTTVNFKPSHDGGNVVTKYEGNVMYLSNSTGTSSATKDTYIELPYRVTLKPNTQYTLSFDYYSAGALSANSSYIYLWNKNNSYSTNDWAVVALGTSYNNSKKRERIVKTFTTNENNIIFQLRFGYVSAGDSWICTEGVKLEEGNKATDWSPAPQDIQDQVDVVSTKYSELKSTVDNFSSTLSSTTTTATTALNTANTANSTANTAKSTADSALSKANTNASSITTISNNYSNLNQTVSGLSSTVSSTSTALANLKVGGTNLLKNSSGVTGNITPWAINGPNNTQFTVLTKSNIDVLNQTVAQSAFKMGRNLTTEGFVYSERFGVKPNTEYTVSGKYLVGSGCKGIEVLFLGSNALDVNSTSQAYDSVTTCASSATVGNGKYISFSKTFTTGASAKSAIVRLDNNGTTTDGTWNYCYFADLMIEEGNKASSWSPSPQDESLVLASYTSKTEFTQSNEDFTFKIQKAGTGNLLKNTKWKNGTYGWSHQCWDTSGTSSRTLSVLPPSTTTDWRHGKDNILQYQATVNSAGAHVRTTIRANQWVPVEPGGVYSMSFYYRQHRCKGNYWEVQGMKADGNYSTIYAFNFESQPGGNSQSRDYSQWYWANKTFTIPSDIVKILVWVVVLQHDSSSSLTSFVWLGEPCLTQSPIPLHWAPHSSEIYEGIVTIDDQGLSVKQGSSKTVLNSTALEFYSGTNKYSKVKDGAFSFTDTSGNNVGVMGRNAWVDTTRYISHMGAYYGHDVALGRMKDTSATTFSAPLIVTAGTHQLPNGAINYDGLNMNYPVVTSVMRFAPTTTSWLDWNNNGYAGYGEVYATGSSGDQQLYVVGKDRLNLSLRGRTLLYFETGEGGVTGDSWMNIATDVNCGNWGFYNFRTATLATAQSSYTQTLLDRGTNEHIMYGGLNYDSGEIRWTWKETVFTYAEADVDPVTDEWVYTGRNICYIELPIFMAENIRNDYHINICKMSWGDYRIIEKTPYYFILESEKEDFGFTFEVVAQFIDSEDLDHNTSVAGSQYLVEDRPDVSEEVQIPFDFANHEFVEEEEVEIPIDIPSITDIQENIIIGED